MSLYARGQRSPVLDRLLDQGLGDRTTIITSVNDVRTCAVRVSQSLSWERVLEQVTTAVFSPACPFADAKTRQLSVARVIVTIGVAGAVIVEGKSSALIFDALGQEGDFEDRFKGMCLGYNTCLVGALAAGWIDSHERLDWKRGVREGLSLARLLHVGGYEAAGSQLQFPHDRLSQGYAERDNIGHHCCPN